MREKSALNSLDDLKSERIKEKLGGRIIGIDPGSGLMHISKQAMEELGLKKFGYTLMASSAPAMTVALKRAIENHEWIVVTAWKPHWLWVRWEAAKEYVENHPKKVHYWVTGDRGPVCAGVFVRHRPLVLAVLRPQPAMINRLLQEKIMSDAFKVGDHVTWNSEAGRVGGTIIKVHKRDFQYKGHMRRASEEEPQYEIKSDKTDHVAAHKGRALSKSE